MTPAHAGPVDRGPGSPGGPLDDGTSGEGAWLELAVTCDPEAVEAISEILAREAPGGVSVEPGFRLAHEGLAAVLDPARPAVVRAYLPARDGTAVRAAVERADAAIGRLAAFGLRDIGELTTGVVHEADWAAAWKQHFPVLRVGRRLVIRPTWRRHRRAPDDVVIAMDPGMAFGTGLHPTTRLCLAGIEAWADEGLLGRGSAPDGRARLLDLGCGSGVLAVAAGLLGAGRLVGLDTDPIAVEATRANARRNGLARRLAARQGSLPSGESAFDLVVANLVASLLVSLAGRLRDEMRPGARLLASGIFVDREDEVTAALDAAGLAMAGRAADGDWVALEATRPA
ncbi:MAG: 50S ribosomal protein L11 methyltransferase [Chloroflexi bacterium]|nr:50S ribosomal protein L11 methyltransferase [Chloroflexota bacterium]